MKQLIILIFIFIFTISIKAQQNLTPFKDALLINESISNGTNDFVEILQKYNPHTPVNTIISGNPFLKKLSFDLIAKVNSASAADNIIIEAQNSQSEYSFIPEGDAVKALGIFIANRFKQELNIAFLNKFKEKLTSQAELKLLFPMTYQFLLDNEPYNYTDFLESLRASLKEDLNAIPSNLGDLLNSKKASLVRAGGSLTSDQFIGLILGLEAIESYINKNSSAEVILNVTGHSEITNITSTTLKSSLEFVNIVTSELSDDVTRDWYPRDEMDDVFGESDARLIFIGLFYEKHKTFYQAIVPLNLQLNLPIYLDKFYRAIKVIEDYKKDLNKNKTFGLKPNELDLINYFELTIKSLETVSDLSEIGITRNPIFLNKTIPAAQDALNILKNIKQKEYATSFVHTLAFISNYGLSGDFKSDFVKYGNFAVNIVTAEDSEGMVKALEAAALPVGSYKIKRNTIANISLNAYAGVFAGGEFLDGRGNTDLPDNVESSSVITGFSAPIGIAFNIGTAKDYSSTNNDHKKLKKYKKGAKDRVLTGASWSVFVSVLDVGAVTAFRLTNDDTEALPALKFENFLAPGVHIIHGFKNSPLSLSLGYQYGPQIRKIKDFENQDQINGSSIRLGLLVDIPIINFYTKSEK
ncbi:hypothetical protein [Flavivirga jejuensis]|uniref:Uncharacterized protein n=1 Tax=Flavivirga jejuensis TaxID=870487 RepID=A0ABT8WUT0_9FLAO|nr:hypothetical protein [Flavivirga jejuensis]MDO5976913.1 hypothetical protein [Flavivirga jejuensis]